MILWTIQTPQVYRKLMNRGVYICDKSKSLCLEDSLFVEAYDWLVKQMDAKGISHPENIQYPVWAWHTHYWKRKQPDLRKSEYGYHGQELVCIEIEVPDEMVLLSDYNTWHYVLNKWYLDDSKSREEWEIIQEEFDKLPPEERNIKMEESWQNIFDITPIDTEWRINGEFIQATFWELKREYIRKVKFFTCR